MLYLYMPLPNHHYTVRLSAAKCFTEHHLQYLSISPIDHADTTRQLCIAMIFFAINGIHTALFLVVTTCFCPVLGLHRQSVEPTTCQYESIVLGLKIQPCFRWISHQPISIEHVPNLPYQALLEIPRQPSVSWTV